MRTRFSRYHDPSMCRIQVAYLPIESLTGSSSQAPSASRCTLQAAGPSPDSSQPGSSTVPSRAASVGSGEDGVTTGEEEPTPAAQLTKKSDTEGQKGKRAILRGYNRDNAPSTPDAT